MISIPIPGESRVERDPFPEPHCIACGKRIDVTTKPDPVLYSTIHQYRADRSSPVSTSYQHYLAADCR